LGTARLDLDTAGVAALTLALLLVLWFQPVSPSAGVIRHHDWLAVGSRC